MEQQVVLILGMHRSGTSCLAGSLQQAGLELGDVSVASSHNSRGNRENPAFVHFNERVLNTSGGAWHEPPADVRLNERQQARARELIASFAGAACWGFKDPRTLLLLDHWQKLLPRATLVGIFRHPAAVAQSLMTRDGMSARRALSLWTCYNRVLLAQYRQQPFALLNFDWDDARLARAVDALCERLGLRVVQERFFDSALRSKPAAMSLPADIAALHDELAGVAARGTSGLPTR